jgi:hypothetical protein
MESEDRKRKVDDITTSTSVPTTTTTATEDQHHQTSSSGLSPPQDKNEKEQDNNVKRPKLALDTPNNKESVKETSKEVVNQGVTKSPEKQEEETKNPSTEAKDDNASAGGYNVNAKTSSSTDETKDKEETKKEDESSTKPKEVEKTSIFGSSVGFSGFGSVKPTGFGMAAGFSSEGNKISGFGNTTGTTFGNNSFAAKNTGALGGTFSSGGSSSFGGGSGGGSTLGFGKSKGFGELNKGVSGSIFGTPINTDTKSDEGKEENVAESDSPDNNNTVVELPTDYEARTGEEEESSLFQARCKTHRLVPAESKEHSANKTPAPATAKAAPAVPHSESLLRKSPTDDGTRESETIVWQEVGIGPLKVLQHDTTKKIRIVQRREVSPSGPATKVIVNAPLHSGSLTKVHQPTEKHVQWTTPIDGKATTYLFKFGSPADASQLIKVLTDNQEAS